MTHNFSSDRSNIEFLYFPRAGPISPSIAGDNIQGNKEKLVKCLHEL